MLDLLLPEREALRATMRENFERRARYQQAPRDAAQCEKQRALAILQAVPHARNYAHKCRGRTPRAAALWKETMHHFREFVVVTYGHAGWAKKDNFKSK